MMKNYCIFAAQFLPHMGGVERYTYNLVQEELRYIPVPNMGMAVIE